MVRTDVVRGKLGKMKNDIQAMAIVIPPSMMKSQRQASSPLVPFICAVIPADMRPEKAPLMREPE